jgi:hypothetical protein
VPGLETEALHRAALRIAPAPRIGWHRARLAETMINRSFTAPFLAIHLIPCVFSFATAASSAAGKEYLECPKHLEAKSGSSSVISCKIRNADKSAVYILKDDFFLEGPVRGQVYLFAPTGWQRFENTLQYSHLSSGLDLPALVDPVAHLDFSRAQSLFVLPANKSVDLDLSWRVPPKPGFPDQGKWAVQVKVVYITHERLSSLVSSKALPDSCREILRRSMSSSTAEGALELMTKRHSGSPRWHYDGCSNVISEKFTHLYSGPIVVNVSG